MSPQGMENAHFTGDFYPWRKQGIVVEEESCQDRFGRGR